MKKILISLMTVALVMGLIGAGAFAYFNDTETSTGNTFTAGTLNLTGSSFVDGTYTGAETNYTVVEGGDGINGNVVFGDDIGIKPGESGTITWSLKNDGTLAGTLSIVASYTSLDVDQNEPELEFDDTDAEGELDDQMWFTLVRTNADESTTTLVSMPAGDIAAVVDALKGETVVMASGDTIVYTLDWGIWRSVFTPEYDNIMQSDTLTLDITFTLEQA